MHCEELLQHCDALAQRIFQTRGETAVCQEVVSTITSLLGAQQGSITLYRPQEQDLAIVATHGYPSVLVESVRIKPGESVIGGVFAAGLPLIVHDIETHQSDRPRRRRYRSASFLCAPIISAGEGLGVVSLTDRLGDNPFDARDLAVVRALTAPVPLALAREQLSQRIDALSREVITDGLTGAFSLRYFRTRVEQDVARAHRGGPGVALVMLDIDDFKRINDRLGHPAGDDVLRRVASILQQTVRTSDVAARLGGEEFAVLMPGSTVESARHIAERMRERIAQHLSPVSVSIGVASLTPECSFQELIERSDQALYRAKAEGKNRVRVWRP